MFGKGSVVMKLFIKQHVFSWGDRFTIYDEQGNDKFYARGEVFTFGKKLHILDLNGNELAYIEQKVFSFLPKYYIYRNVFQVAEVIKEFSFFRQSYTINGLDWEVDGDFFAHEYEISTRDEGTVSVSKEWFTFGDAYEIDIDDRIDAVDALAAVLVIDACITNNDSTTC